MADNNDTPGQADAAREAHDSTPAAGTGTPEEATAETPRVTPPEAAPAVAPREQGASGAGAQPASSVAPGVGPQTAPPVEQSPVAQQPSAGAPAAGEPTTPAPPAAATPMQSAAPQPPAPPHPTAHTPGAQRPAVQSSPVQSPTVQSPTVQSPTVQSPTVQSPAAQLPGTQAPGMQSPAASSPAASNSAASNPAASGTWAKNPPASGSPAPQHPAPHASSGRVDASETRPLPGAAFGAPGSGYPTATSTPQQTSPNQPGATPPQGPDGLPRNLGAPVAPGQAAPSPKTKRSYSNGTFIAGLAVAALVGGIVGGGVSSLVMANAIPKTGAVSQQGGAVTLNNPETATEISGVAMVATPSVVTLSVESQSASGSGSGVIYSEDGYIITNAHVVTLDGAATDARIRVKHSDGRVFDAKLVGIAPYSDIAVLKVEAEGLTPIEVADSSKVNVGDLAVAIGAPMSLSNTVTSGVVSALNRGISVGSALIPQDPTQEGQENHEGEDAPDSGRGFPWDFRFDTPGESGETQASGGQVTLPVVQTDASINPGNSGGALLNGKGELIGINVAIASPGATEGNASSAGLGFAIPADLATRVADEIIDGEKPSHGLLGASVVDSSLDDDADANHAGGLIKELVRGGAAAKAGLKIGDVITAVDGVAAADGTSVSALIRMHAGGSEVTIDYTRNGVAGQATATLGTLDW